MTLFLCLRKIPIRTFSHGGNHMSITFEKESGWDGSWGLGLGKGTKGRVKIRYYFDDVCQYTEHDAFPAIVDFYFFYDEPVDMQLTRSQ